MRFVPWLTLPLLALAFAPQSPTGPVYSADGKLQLPADYREWVFLSSGLDMSYDAHADAPAHSTFNNVFADPVSYRSFLATGTWPEGTMLMLENRRAETGHSINLHGQTQAAEVTGLEIHVKDSARNPGGWGFYAFAGQTAASRIPQSASCYSCHQQHAAVDTTFTQFYPTLMPIAERKNTLSEAYRRELLATPQK